LLKHPFIIFGSLPTWAIYRNLEKNSHQNILSFKMGSALAPPDTNAPIHYAQLQNWQIKQLRRQQQQNRLLLAETSFLTNCRISTWTLHRNLEFLLTLFFEFLQLKKSQKKRSSFYCFSIFTFSFY
jgi:hypothetical protein